jgi:hypothetical protein
MISRRGSPSPLPAAVWSLMSEVRCLISELWPPERPPYFTSRRFSGYRYNSPSLARMAAMIEAAT